MLPYAHARWVMGADTPDELKAKRIPMSVTDMDDRPVGLFRNEFELGVAVRDNPEWKFEETAPLRSA
jgi:peptide subunit release factor RF-3